MVGNSYLKRVSEGLPVIRSGGPSSRPRTARPDPAISGILLPISVNGAPASMRKQVFAFSAVLGMAIAAGAEEDWRLHGGSQTDQRFSPLNQINEAVSYTHLTLPTTERV